MSKCGQECHILRTEIYHDDCMLDWTCYTGDVPDSILITDMIDLRDAHGAFRRANKGIIYRQGCEPIIISLGK